MIIRPETPSDFTAIRGVEEAAFSEPAEAWLVDSLRNAGDLVFSLVAIQDEKVVGHAAFSKMKAPFPALSLGPIAVLPARQRMGIGSLLIRDGLARSEAAAWRGVFVLGNPAYYGRFGFRVDLAGGFDSPYGGPHLMALALGYRELPARRGSMEYASAFASVRSPKR
jgi:putative acetyltransferase